MIPKVFWGFTWSVVTRSKNSFNPSIATTKKAAANAHLLTIRQIITVNARDNPVMVLWVKLFTAQKLVNNEFGIKDLLAFHIEFNISYYDVSR